MELSNDNSTSELLWIFIISSHFISLPSFISAYDNVRIVLENSSTGKRETRNSLWSLSCTRIIKKKQPQNIYIRRKCLYPPKCLHGDWVCCLADVLPECRGWCTGRCSYYHGSDARGPSSAHLSNTTSTISSSKYLLVTVLQVKGGDPDVRSLHTCCQML